MRLTSRREWLQETSGGVLAAAILPGMNQTPSTDGRYRGVMLGVQSYSFREMKLEEAIAGMNKLGIRSSELWHRHVEPAGSREELRKWRETVSLDHYHRLREQFAKAGVTVATFDFAFRDDSSDAEVDRAFEMAKALGAGAMTSSANVKVVSRIAAAAARHKLRVGMHNHSRIDPNEFATPESLTNAMNQSPFIVTTLDIGHFTAANFDAVPFLKTHHARVVSLHIKDRLRNQGETVPFGTGDAPIAAVLRLLRDEGWPIVANIEYEYKGANTIEEVGKCLDFCRKALDS